VQEFVDIGWVSRPRGLRGEVWVTAYSDQPERLLELRDFRLHSPRETRLLRKLGGHCSAGRLSLLFEGIADRTQAESLCGATLQIHRRDLPPLAEDEVFLADLMGLEARLADGRVVGRVEGVMELPAGPVLEIRARGLEALVPFHRRFVPRLDMAAAWLELDVPEGMIPEGMLDP
jgi:16S rRNA processing protein RimM